MRKKSFSVLVLIAIFLFVCLTGCNSNILSDTTTSPTTEPTTLSEEEILKNHINDINEDISERLKEDYDFLDTTYVGYVNFQDFIHGLESNPSDYFFLGTDSYDLSQEYSNTKFYKNCDALEQLKEWDLADVDYMLLYITVKKDAYGKEQERSTEILVREENDGNYTWWLYDGHAEFSLAKMIIGVATDRCKINH